MSFRNTSEANTAFNESKSKIRIHRRWLFEFSLFQVIVRLLKEPT